MSWGSLEGSVGRDGRRVQETFALWTDMLIRTFDCINSNDNKGRASYFNYAYACGRALLLLWLMLSSG